jgi:hypothetical protein
MLGDTTLPSVAGLDLQAVDEVDHVVEATAGTGSDAASGNGDGQMGLAPTGKAPPCHGAHPLQTFGTAGVLTGAMN